MILKSQVYAQAALLAGELDTRQQLLLQALCAAAVSVLAGRLRDGITPESCGTDFITAASLYALASWNQAEAGTVAEFRAGDLTLKQGTASGNDASLSLMQQAEGLLRPYVKDSFAFMGV